MKKILFPCTNRTHKARQQMLFAELKKEFELHTISHTPQGEDMPDKAVNTADFFNNAISTINPDILLIRGDRYEQLPIAMLGAYYDKVIVHLEGGDLSGSIDNKVRHSITQLADLHFATNEESRQRIIEMGIPVDKVFNFGSLDVEYAHGVETRKIDQKPYLLLLHHNIPSEDTSLVREAISSLSQRFEVITTKGNEDYKKNPYGEEFKPEYFINLLRQAKCVIGNSSAGIKECSILGTPVVNVGTRQKNRLRTHNVIDVPHNLDSIKKAVEYQIEQKYEPDLTYYQEGTSKKICQEIKKNNITT